MFPLSEESESLALGWLDTYFWSEFELEIIPKLQEGIPRLVLIRDAGKFYSLYEGDIYDLNSITKYLRQGHKDQAWHQLPRGKTPDYLQYTLNAVSLVCGRVSHNLFSAMGLGEAHWTL